MARQGRRHCGSSTRRDVLAIIAMLGSGWAAGGGTASAQPASERPKEGDLLVSAESETVLAPTDVPLGGPPVLAWPMDATNKPCARIRGSTRSYCCAWIRRRLRRDQGARGRRRGWVFRDLSAHRL